jgi:two-component system, OmpR family, phosphate regulon sensor histidine kinase PhoR
MHGRKLFWQIYLPFLLIIMASLLGIWWYSFRYVRNLYRTETVRHLQSKALIIEELIVNSDGSLNVEAAVRVCVDVGRRIDTRITVIMPSGEVVADSDQDVSLMDNHANRPEIIAAFKGGTGYSVRYSSTVRRNMIYVGCPIEHDGSVKGVVRTAIPLGDMDEAMHTIWLRGSIAVLLIVLLTSGLSLLILRRMSRPLELLQAGAERYAAGDLTFRLRSHGSKEMISLTESMNRMAENLQERMRTTARQKHEQDAVFASMSEGVMAVDIEQRVMHVNNAAAQLLGLHPESMRGRSIHEVVRNVALHRLINDTLAGDDVVEVDITLDRDGEKFLQAHGASLRDESGQRIGAVIVLGDVTRLRRLENVRRDFVGNVSHELRTPITSIKGFVDTLRDGAADDPDTRKRFLDILARQVSRVEAILDDLLELSRLEHDVDSKDIETAQCDLAEVIKEAVEVCSDRAGRKNIRLVLSCPQGLTVKLNAPLFEQAIINLIDNAVKYSEEGSVVDIAGGSNEVEMFVAVKDHGCGIEKQHLPRLFERFYRVDKGRSRQLGGTGLGLAIVKHIVTIHRGTVLVESTPGKGSTFTIRIPVAK